MGRRAEAVSAAKAGDSFPHLAMKKCPHEEVSPAGTMPWGGLEAWYPCLGTGPWGRVSMHACGLGLCFKPESGLLLVPGMPIFLASSW